MVHLPHCVKKGSLVCFACQELWRMVVGSKSPPYLQYTAEQLNYLECGRELWLHAINWYQRVGQGKVSRHSHNFIKCSAHGGLAILSHKRV